MGLEELGKRVAIEIGTQRTTFGVGHPGHPIGCRGVDDPLTVFLEGGSVGDEDEEGGWVITDHRVLTDRLPRIAYQDCRHGVGNLDPIEALTRFELQLGPEIHRCSMALQGWQFRCQVDLSPAVTRVPAGCGRS